MKLSKLFVVLAMSFATVSAFAQMPDADQLKAQADAAGKQATQDTQKAEASAHSTAESTMKKVEAKALVNLNTASAADLTKVPGIGPSRAQAIIAARPYKSLSDLKKVKGIKEGVIAQIKPYVTVK